MKSFAKSALTVFPMLAALVSPIFAQSVIVTAVGTDLVFGAQGRLAAAAALGPISRVTLDPNGNPVFSDANYHLVFRVAQDGSIQVIAGNNVQGLANAPGHGLGASGGGYSGDEGPANMAALNRPLGVAYDAAGNLYIADTFNNRIRKVDTQGTIHTFAGTGQAGYQDSAQALNASFNNPTDIVLDKSGNLYVNDVLNVRIRKITPQGVVSTIAGTGLGGSACENGSASSTPLGDIEGMAVDSQGNLYLSDFKNFCVARVSGGQITTVAGNGSFPFNGNGPALNVTLQPSGLAFDPGGNLLISDTGHHLIRKLAGGVVTTVAGIAGQAGFAGDGGSAVNAELHNPFGIATSQTGEIYIADRDNFRLRHINISNSISTAAGNGRLISSQNGVSSAQATLLDPFGVSVDSSGALLVADSDNNILRRMNADGTLATIAGTGAAESTGDNGQATQAGLAGPVSVAADASNNLYEAEINFGVVRKIGASGSIATIVPGLGAPTQAIPDLSGNVYISDFGNNQVLRRSPNGSTAQFPAGFSFSRPAGLATDGLGNLYVTEWGSGLVRRVSSSGNVTTIAGGGLIAGTAADGGPATNAKLGQPSGIAVDSSGSVYFSDASNASVRKVGLDSTISTIAGNGHRGFSGDNGPATSASLGEPWGLAFDHAGALYIADVANNRIRKVLLNSPAPTFTVDRSSLSISAATNGAISDPATVTASSSLTGLLFSIGTDQPWLTATPASGASPSSLAMPAALQVTADPTGLAPGLHTGNVTILAPGANPGMRTVAVNFNVAGPAAPSIVSDTNILSYAFIAGAAPLISQVSIRNGGSGPLNYTASLVLDNASGWMSVSPASGSATSNTAGLITVSVTPGQLAAGTYTGTLTITSAGVSPVKIPVSASVSTPSSKLVLSQFGLTFGAIQGGGSPLPRSFGIVNGGQGSMQWTASVTTTTPWLSVSPASGSVTAPLTDVSRVTASINPSGLAAGTYYGLVTVNAPGNPPQTVTVALNVLPSSAGTGVDVDPGGLVFTGVPGSNPGSQTFSVANLGSQPLKYTSSRLVPSGQPWFVQVPASGVIAPNQTETIVVQPDYSSLQAGAYQGSIALQFSDGTNATNAAVSLLALVQSSPAAQAEPGREKPDASGCGSITIALLSPSAPLTVTVGQAVSVKVSVSDSCGKVTSADPLAQVWLGFSDKDQIVTLTADSGNPGNWSGGWTPTVLPPSGSTTVHIDALETRLPFGEILVTANVSAAAVPPPVVPSAKSIVNSASGAPIPVSPGGLVSIYGSNLADATAQQILPPLQTSLGNVQVLLGDQPLPLLYASSGQINAQIPPDLPPSVLNGQLQLRVQRDGTIISVAPPVPVAAAAPAIFTQNEMGYGQGDVLNTIGNLVDPSSPAKVGDIVSIYCTGLGAVSPSVPAGQPAPSDPLNLSRTTNPVTVTIGGVTAPQIYFAGLAPGYAGLYQVNVQIPPGVASGNQSVVVSVANQSSPSVVTIAIQ